jgi:diguanylate cyclase (GGDEF)-like protein
LSLDNFRERHINKYEAYELVYLKTSVIFQISSAVVYIADNILLKNYSFITTDPVHKMKLIGSAAVCILVFAIQLARYKVFRSILPDSILIYCLEKILFSSMVSAIAIYSDIGEWFYIGYMLPICMTTYIKGPKYGYGVSLICAMIHMSMLHEKLFPAAEGAAGIPVDIIRSTGMAFALYVISFICVYFFGGLYRNRIEEEFHSTYATEQFKEHYEMLKSEMDDIMQKYSRLISSSDKLEKSNRNLSKSIAEFYTLNQISQAIGSILDTKELLKRFNDIILGVVGGSYSSIILYDEESGRLKVHTTNVANPGELATIADNINSGILLDALMKGEYILENNVDYYQYLFTCGRNINSLMCIPLTTGSRKFGLILVEHTLSNAFDSENIRFLRIIAQQVGIVMENAELYLKMKEMARKDGLTGIYNRQYFQERLQQEFKEAQRNGYPLSLVMYDIDHFKKFNDMYGHLFGDKVLKSVAEVVRSTLRKTDMIARYGGEEFTILLPYTNLEDAYEKVEALRKMIAKHVIEDNLISVSVTASFGISSFDECALTENDLVRTADDALYEAKAAGRNCVMTARRLYEAKH